MNMLAAVATPRWRQSTLAWIETRKAGLQNPIPTPITSDAVAANATLLSGVIIKNSKPPERSATPPIAADRRYEVRIISRPAMIEAIIQLTDCAAERKPGDAGAAPHHALHIGGQERAESPSSSPTPVPKMPEMWQQGDDRGSATA